MFQKLFESETGGFLVRVPDLILLTSRVGCLITANPNYTMDF